MNTHPITNQPDLRDAFWRAHPHLLHRPGSQNAQPCDTRVAWVDYVDACQRDGTISEALARRATL